MKLEKLEPWELFWEEGDDLPCHVIYPDYTQSAS